MKIRPIIQRTTMAAILVTSVRMLTFTLLIAAFAASSFAATLNWTGTGTVAAPASGKWDTNTANQWQTGASGSGNSAWVIPSSDALFGGQDGTYAINVATNIPVTKFIRFDFNGYTLTSAVPTTVTMSGNGSGAVGAGNANIELASGKTVTIGTNVTVQMKQQTFIVGGTTTANAGTLSITNGGVVQETDNGNANLSTHGMVGVGTTMNVQTGGSFRTAVGSGAGAANFLNGSASGDNCTINVAGGTFSFIPSGAASIFKVSGNAANANTVTGTLNVNAGLFTMAGGNGNNTMAMTFGSAGTGTINLNGGTLAVTEIVNTGSGGTTGGSGTFNFNGGTLQACTNIFASTFLNGLTAANVKSGGAVIDNNGFAITVGQTLLNGVGGTDGGLIATNSGAGGSLALTNANTYNGPTIVKSGAYLATTTRSTGAGSYSVDDGATLEVQAPISSGQLAMSSLTEGTSGNLTNVFTLGANASTGTPAIAVSGALTLNGTVTVNATASSLSSANTYLLLSYVSVSGSGSFVAGSLPPISGFVPAITNDISAKQLKLYYMSAPPPVQWAVGDGNWDTTTFNWVPLGGGTATNYTEGSLAALDDSATVSSPVVTLTGDRSPNMVTNNSTKNYTLAGSGSFLTGVLLKNGGSTLTLDNGSANAFSSISISGGTLQIGNNDTGGSLGSSGVTNNGTLAFNRTDNVTFANVIAGSGGVTQSGSGAITLSGATIYTGSTTVSAGKLVATTASTGAGAYTAADNATLEVQVAASGKSLTNSSLMLGTSGSLTTVFTLGANGSTTVPVIQDVGALTLNGTVTVNVTGSGLAAGTYPLISYASTTGSGSFVAGSLPVVTACTGVLTNDTTARQLKLVYTTVTTLTWDSGNTANGTTIDAGSGTWDKVPSNIVWNDVANGGINRSWGDSIKALFAGADGTWAITVATNVSPTRMEFANSGYTLSASSTQTITFTSGGSGAVPNIQIASGKTATIGTNVTVTSTATTIWGNTNGTAGGELDIANGGTLQTGGPTAGMVGAGSVTSVKTGGQLTMAGTTTALILGSVASDNCTLSVDGGTVSFPASTAVKVGGNSAAAAVLGGTLTINGGSFSMFSGNTTLPMTLGFAASNLGTNNLNGGVLSVNEIVQGSGNGYINFNGGTLKAVNGAFASTFMSGLTAANVQSGGAVIDNNGFGITIGQALLNGGGTDGGLTSLGAGSLTLTGVNTYNGNTTISAGRLALSGSGSISSSAGIVVAGGATFDVSASTFALGSSQTLSNSTSTATLSGNVDASVGTVSLTYASGTPSFTVTNGTLTLASGTTFKVNNAGAALTAGSYKLVATNTAGLVTGTPPSVTVGGSGLVSGATATLQITSSELYLAVSAGTPPTPHITDISLSGTTLNLTATNGADNGTYVLLQSTNVALPLAQWAPVLTNTFDGNGNLNLSTNIVDPSVQQQFYILSQ